jgi:nitrite reductase (NO-forming)
MFADRERAIRTVLKGLAGPITVNGVAYQGSMPALETILTDTQVADVLTYVFNTWGNSGEAFDPAHIARRRAEWAGLPRITAAPTPVE